MKRLLRSSSAGFTILEITIVMVIGGLLLATFSTALVSLMERTKMKTTNIRINTINDAIQQYLSINGALPCPAPGIIAVDQAGYGTSIETDTHSLPAIRHCDNATAVAGVTRVASAITAYTPNAPVDLDGPDPGAAPSGAAYPLFVRIGVVPIRSLNLPDDFLIDAWGHRFIYAVTEQLTNPYRFFQDSGGISVIDSAGNSVVQPANTAHYVIISPGRDGVGGVVGDTGNLSVPCDLTTFEGENCDFLVGTINPTFRKTIITTAAVGGATQFDDVVIIGAQSQSAELIPTGAVMAFDIPGGTCPAGWSQYAAADGRVIIGTTPVGGAINYNLGDSGGTAMLTLNTTNMPSHNHLFGQTASQGVTAGGVTIDYVKPAPQTLITSSTGDGQPFDNRQPWRALLYCKKD